MTAAGQPARHGLSIGAVLARLRLDFPDVTISKIRFLESEGLVRPARTPSGYRQFSVADVERLRFVLAAQRDHYLPLKVIKEQLDAVRGEPPELPQPPRGLVSVRPAEEPPDPGELIDPDRSLTEADLLAEAEIDQAVLAELKEYGLIRPTEDGGYDGRSVAVARTVQALAEFGLEPRHLRAFRVSVEREVGLLEQIVTPLYLQRDPAAKARADEVAGRLATLSVTLHTLLVQAGIRRLTSG